MIQTHDLTKVYGNLHAIDSLDISLGERDVFGFIGPNGAGKTTTMKILTTLLEPSWGEATVCGYSIYTHAAELRRVIGYMPDFFGVYEDMQVIEQQVFKAAIQGKGKLTVLPEQAIVVTRILEAIYESAKTGKPVYFK